MFPISRKAPRREGPSRSVICSPITLSRYAPDRRQAKAGLGHLGLCALANQESSRRRKRQWAHLTVDWQALTRSDLQSGEALPTLKGCFAANLQRAASNGHITTHSTRWTLDSFRNRTLHRMNLAQARRYRLSSPSQNSHPPPPYLRPHRGPRDSRLQIRKRPPYQQALTATHILSATTVRITRAIMSTTHTQPEQREVVLGGGALILKPSLTNLLLAFHRDGAQNYEIFSAMDTSQVEISMNDIDIAQLKRRIVLSALQCALCGTKVLPRPHQLDLAHHMSSLHLPQ